MKDEKTLDGMIATEKKKLSKLEERQDELNKKIKACKATIEKYTLMKNNQQLISLANVLEGNGLSIEDILAAVQAGELNSLVPIKKTETIKEDTEESPVESEDE